MSRNSRKEPEYWMRRAEQARAEAKSAPDMKTRSVLVGFATAYESLANRARIQIGSKDRLTLLARARDTELTGDSVGL